MSAEMPTGEIVRDMIGLAVELGRRLGRKAERHAAGVDPEVVAAVERINARLNGQDDAFDIELRRLIADVELDDEDGA